jgi:hypothetical protein
MELRLFLFEEENQMNINELSKQKQVERGIGNWGQTPGTVKC